MRKFVVTASHPVNARYSLVKDVVRVYKNLNHKGMTTYYAMHGVLGCGKDSANEQQALRSLLADHALTNVIIHGELVGEGAENTSAAPL